jgi:hypothetical protein
MPYADFDGARMPQYQLRQIEALVRDAMQRQTLFHVVKAAVNPNCYYTVFETNLKECRATLP